MSENFCLHCESHGRTSWFYLRNVQPKWLDVLNRNRVAIEALADSDLEIWGRVQLESFDVDVLFVRQHQGCLLRLRSEYETGEP